MRIFLLAPASRNFVKIYRNKNINTTRNMPSNTVVPLGNCDSLCWL